MAALNDRHRGMLARSGIDLECAGARGFETITYNRRGWFDRARRP
jgi:hypothetical protein